MTTEELMRPRVKVIAPAPLMKNEVGSFLKRMDDGKEFSFGISTGAATHFYPLSDFESWPYIFRICNWWEERSIEDLPGYLKANNGKVAKIDPSTLSPDGKWVTGENGADIYLFYWQPATLEEYQSYQSIKSLK